MSITRTFTVTVAGGKFVIDGTSQATINIAETGTYKFDQSDSTNGSHPLRFSTTSDGTHDGGSEYTTGVTTYGTPGGSGAYTQITVAASAPTLYYYCSNHSGMGGQADTPTANTWGIFPWNNNQWGDQDAVDVSVTAPSTLTSAVGDVEASNEEGWGRQEWGNSGWNVDYSVGLSGLGLTSSLGTLTAEQEIPVDLTGLGLTSSLGSVSISLTVPITAPAGLTASVGEISEDVYAVGWGRDAYGEEPWGSSDDAVVGLTAPSSLSTSIGSVTAFNEQGWGRDPWGYENWGESAMTVVVDVSGVSLGSSVGAISPTEMSIGLTGQSATSSVGTPGLSFGVSTEPISSAGVGTISVGTLIIGNEIQIAGVGATASVGSISPADVVGLTGLGATSSIGSPDVSDAQIFNITGIGATSSVGSISPTEMAIGLSTAGVATTGVGSIAPTEMAVGLTGVTGTISLGEVSPLYTRILEYNTSGNYTIEDYNTSATYTEKKHAG